MKLVSWALLSLALIASALGFVFTKAKAARHALLSHTEPAAPYTQAHPATGVNASAKRLDEWQVIGPGGGGALYSPAISPHDMNLRLLSCDMGGSYITHDGGQTWRQFNLHGTQRFAFDPNDPKVIFAYGGRAVFRSIDQGETWNVVFPRLKDINQVGYFAEGSLAIYASGVGLQEGVAAFAVDPKDSKTWFLATESQAKMTRDGGETWTTLGPLARASMAVVDPFSPPDNRRVVFIRRNGASLLADGKIINQPPIKIRGNDVWIERVGMMGAAFAPGRSSIYVILEHSSPTEGGLLLSQDGGASWQQAERGFTSQANADYLPEYAAIAIDPRHPETFYLSYTHLRPSSEPRHEYFGVARTTDAGAHWESVWKQDARPSAAIHDSWITSDLGATWGENPQSLAVAPKDMNKLLAGDFGRCLRSDDGGRNWQQCYSRQLPDGSYTTTGLNTTTAYGLHVDPFDRNRLYISYTDIGLFRSDNGGDGWVRSMNGVPHAWQNTAYWIDFDPTQKGKAWMATSSLHDLPWEMSLRKLPHAQGGIMVTTNGGQSWQIAGKLPQGAYTHILVDAKSPAEKRVVYATAMGAGVWKSEDGGNSWQLKNSGLPDKPLAWRLTQAPDHSLLLVITRRSDDLKPENVGAVYRSTDGAEHWKRVTLPQGMNGPMTVECDPENPNRLYLAAFGHSDIASVSTAGGVFVSIDGGVTWNNTLSTDQHIYDVHVDPRNHHVVYASGFESSVWRSEDSGMTWQRLGGFNFNAAHRVVPDPVDPSKIFVTTFGSSVWHGPAKGDPNAAEDITTPILEYKHVLAQHPR